MLKSLIHVSQGVILSFILTSCGLPGGGTTDNLSFDKVKNAEDILQSTTSIDDEVIDTSSSSSSSSSSGGDDSGSSSSSGGDDSGSSSSSSSSGGSTSSSSSSSSSGGSTSSSSSSSSSGGSTSSSSSSSSSGGSTSSSSSSSSSGGSTSSSSSSSSSGGSNLEPCSDIDLDRIREVHVKFDSIKTGQGRDENEVPLDDDLDLLNSYELDTFLTVYKDSEKPRLKIVQHNQSDLQLHYIVLEDDSRCSISAPSALINLKSGENDLSETEECNSENLIHPTGQGYKLCIPAAKSVLQESFSRVSD